MIRKENLECIAISDYYYHSLVDQSTSTMNVEKVKHLLVVVVTVVVVVVVVLVVVVVVVADVVVTVVTVVVGSADAPASADALLTETPKGMATDAAAAISTMAPRSTLASIDAREDLSKNRDKLKITSNHTDFSGIHAKRRILVFFFSVVVVCS